MDWRRKDYPAGSRSTKCLGKQKGDYASYKRFMMAQITELIDRYRPGNIWFDGEWDHAHFKNGKWVRTLDWEMDSIYDLIHSKRVLVANNNHQPIRPKEDIQIFERDLRYARLRTRQEPRRQRNGQNEEGRRRLFHHDT